MINVSRLFYLATILSFNLLPHVSSTSVISKPVLNQINDGYNIVGQNLKLRCTIELSTSMPVAFEWITPDKNGQKSRRIHVSDSIKTFHGTVYQELTIMKTTSDDVGEYTCTVKDLIHENNSTIIVILFVPDLLEKPYIKDLSGGHTVVGDSLTLNCTVKAGIPFIMNWNTPDKFGLENGRISLTGVTKGSDGVHYQELTINETTLGDQGNYTCTIMNFISQDFKSTTKFVKVFEKNEFLLNLTEQNEIYTISVKEGEKSVQWYINVAAHPIPRITWRNNKDEEIKPGCSLPKYEVRTDNSSYAFLKINNIGIDDAGYYTIGAENDFQVKSLRLLLNVTEKTDKSSV